MVHFSVHVYIEVDLLALLLPNMLFMVYKGSWILKTRGIPYYFLIFYGFCPLFFHKK